MKLQTTHEGKLLGSRLETSVTKLGGSVNELQLHLLLSAARRVGKDALSQGQHTLLHAGSAALDQQEVMLHHTIVRETAEGVDRLLRRICLGSGVACDLKQVEIIESKHVEL